MSKPGRGDTVQFYSPNLDTKINLSNSKSNELPTVQTVYYWEVFTSRSFLTFDENFLTTLYWFLCQVGSTVLISSKPTKLVALAEVLRTIIFPFEYDDSYMPLISEANYGYLAAPFPILIGVIAETEDEIEVVESLASDKSLLVFIDRDELKVKFYNSVMPIKNFRKEFEEEKGKQFSCKNFPPKNVKELKKAMKKTLKDCDKLASQKLVVPEVKSSLVEEIRQNFLSFFVSMFKNYESCLKEDKHQTSFSSSSFNTKSFLEKENMKYDFYVDLFNTRAWILFLENKMFLPTAEAESHIEYFDNCIRRLTKK